MVRLLESNRIINPKRYYLWSYIPDNQVQNRLTPSGKFFYQKRICGIPFYTTLHARRMMYYQLGIESFSTVHIIRGRKLIREGIKYLDYKHPQLLWYRNRLRSIRKWITPPDYLMNKHRRRRFRVKMYECFTKHGKKKFNEELVRVYYGYRPGTTIKHKNFNRFKAYKFIVPQVAKALRIPEEDIIITFKRRSGIHYNGSIDPFLQEGTPEYETLYKKGQEDG